MGMYEKCIHYGLCYSKFKEFKELVGPGVLFQIGSEEDHFNKKCRNCDFFNDGITNEIKHDKSEFTDDELLFLKMAFKLIDDVAEIERTSNSDVDRINAIFNLKEKLGIYEVLEE